MPFFSIIAPCYNVAAYVDDMIASVLNQPFGDFELLLSVERSTDETKARCLAASEKDSRVRVVFGERSGSPATPRNRAFSVAKGRYVVWLDGDDWLAEGVLGDLAEAIRAHGEPDIVHGTLDAMRPDATGALVRAEHVANFPPSDDGRVFTGREATIRLLARSATPFFGAPLSVCRADFLRGNDLMFVHGLCHEDEEWTPRLFYFAETFLVLDRTIFVYRHHPGSIMATQLGSHKIVEHAIVERSLIDFHATHEFSPALSRAWARGVTSLFYFHFFYPTRRFGETASDWGLAMRHVLREGGLRNFLKLARFASLPKRVGAILVVPCKIHPVFGWLAYAYFRFLYYPVVMRRARRGGE